MDTITIGAATVTRIEESYEPNFEATKFFAEWTPAVVDEHREWMLPGHFDPATGKLKLSIHSWLVKAGGRTILIDACVGNDKERPNRPMWHRMKTPYLDRLAKAGARPEQIDAVMCTHLHNDHVGWNTPLDNGQWGPTVPNGRYLFNQTAFHHFQNIRPEMHHGKRRA